MKAKIWLGLSMLLLVSCTHKIHFKKKEAKIEIPDLNGAWAITEVNGMKVVKEKAGIEMPYIEFNTALNSLTGSTGCNRISGKAVVGNAVVNFENFVSSRMHCDNALYETPLLQLMRGSLSYQLENGQLIFTKEGKKVLVFQK